MNSTYKYLFPFERIPYQSKILIYGAGTLGQAYLRQMQMTHYCEVLAMVDKNHAQYPPMIVPVIAPDRMKEYQYDYVVVALRTEISWNEIKRVLAGEGVQEDRIVCIFERAEDEGSLFLEADSGDMPDGNEETPAYLKTRHSVAILTTGGLGDMVVQKRFVMELIRYSPDCRIDFYAVKTTDFLRYLYMDCSNVNQVIPDLGSRYAASHSKYALAFSMEACHYLKMNTWKAEEFSDGRIMEKGAFADRVSRLKEAADAEELGNVASLRLALFRRLYQGLNAYSAFNYHGAFDIRDKRVTIPMDRNWEGAFRDLGLGKYITVNYGNGDCADGSKIAKSWHKKGFEEVIALFQEKYPDIQIVQIGDANAGKLDGAGCYVLGKDIRLSAYILKNAVFHLDIEGGLVHIATQLGTKCVVLFGPTVKEYYGYEQNINIRTGNCRDCWGLYSDVNRCARGLQEPECMYSITPEMVMEKIEEYMRSAERGES